MLLGVEGENVQKMRDAAEEALKYPTNSETRTFDDGKSAWDTMVLSSRCVDG